MIIVIAIVIAMAVTKRSVEAFVMVLTRLVAVIRAAVALSATSKRISMVSVVVVSVVTFLVIMITPRR